MILIFGAGISGLGAYKLLKSKNKDVYLIDDKESELKTKDALEFLETKNIEYIVKSPGISFENIFIKKAIEKNVEIISEIDLAYKYMNKDIKIIAFTGTNGKTTTCSKTYELLKKADYKVALGGNVGKSFAEIVFENENLEYIVLELSSYQLENNPKIKTNISGIINLSPDHLARYKDEDDYYLTKFNIFKNQSEKDYTIINLDDFNFKRFDKKIISNKITLSKKNKADIYVKDSYIYYDDSKLINIEELSLKGEHNLENMLFVIATAKILNISKDIIVKFLKDTQSIEHRMEEFYNKNNVIFVNDSKGTNVDSTIKAINSYKDEIVLICGGEDKKVPLENLAKAIKEKVSYVYIYGENRYLIENVLKKENYTNYIIFETVDECIRKIKEVENFENKKYYLFSPATASFDQFLNFEQRGKYFKEIVKGILGD